MPYPYVSMNRCYDNRLQSLPSAVRNTTETLFSLPTKKGAESNDSAPFFFVPASSVYPKRRLCARHCDFLFPNPLCSYTYALCIVRHICSRIISVSFTGCKLSLSEKRFILRPIPNDRAISFPCTFAFRLP